MFSIARHLGLLLAFCLSLPAIAGEVPLRAFEASYSLHKGSMHIGVAELSLEPDEQLWRWRLTTQARGIYAILIHKKLYSETTFTRNQHDVRLQQIVIGDEKDEEDFESASFDWESQHMNVLRKGKRNKVALDGDVYDYLSIHLLAADMQRRKRDEKTVDFYRKGKLARLKLAYLGRESITIGDEEIEARVYKQTRKGSSTVVRYFYDPKRPLLPLLIENRKGDDSPSILRLREVDWKL